MLFDRADLSAIAATATAEAFDLVLSSS